MASAAATGWPRARELSSQGTSHPCSRTWAAATACSPVCGAQERKTRSRSAPRQARSSVHSGPQVRQTGGRGPGGAGHGGAGRGPGCRGTRSGRGTGSAGPAGSAARTGWRGGPGRQRGRSRPGVVGSCSRRSHQEPGVIPPGGRREKQWTRTYQGGTVGLFRCVPRQDRGEPARGWSSTVQGGARAVRSYRGVRAGRTCAAPGRLGPARATPVTPASAGPRVGVRDHQATRVARVDAVTLSREGRLRRSCRRTRTGTTPRLRRRRGSGRTGGSDPPPRSRRARRTSRTTPATTSTSGCSTR